MNVTFTDFSPNLPEQKRYERGIDYVCHDFDLEFEDAFYLIERLKRNQSSVVIYAPLTTIDFFIFNNALEVQIDGESTWVASIIDLEAAREISRVTYEGCKNFGSQIPGTNWEWDASFL